MTYAKTYNPCDDCSHSFSKNNQESSMCKICEFRQSLDLINRLQAENERLRNQVIARDNMLVNLTTGSGVYRHLTFESLTTLQIKAEAYKEFAERLKEKEEILGYDPIYGNQVYVNAWHIDNLLKKLVGEDK